MKKRKKNIPKSFIDKMNLARHKVMAQDVIALTESMFSRGIPVDEEKIKEAVLKANPPFTPEELRINYEFMKSKSKK